MNFEWELLTERHDIENKCDLTYRVNVIGGWLIKHEILLYKNEIEIEGFIDATVTMNFISDPNHSWEIDGVE